MLERKRRFFITYAISLASASTLASLFPGLVNIPAIISEISYACNVNKHRQQEAKLSLG